MSSILHPIHSASQKCRPKHQVLVLKCYPKYQKTVQEVKPNSSELSYLCYYASTRPSKLQKVGAFLEKKTASDVWRVKLGNVQVTLQILTAIIEKTPRDLPLYSRSVLTILDSILRSKDITMVEESIHTFEALCKHMDGVSVSADQQRANQFLSIVQLYAEFAGREQAENTKSGDSVPLTIRWRTAGFRAIRAIVSSDALAADFAKQLQIVMPVILDNLALDNNNILATLQQRVPTSEKFDTEMARRRRASAATVATVDTIEGNPVSATQTTADADRAAEDEVRVLAVRCLKQIFSTGIGVTRGQTRLATTLTLKFIASKHPQLTAGGKLQENNWATSLIEAIARWTPVQDRFIIALTAVETLVRSPINESLLEKQLVLATLIDWLLSSSINLIGLSVMDVLLGFVHHTLVLLQLGGKDMKIAPMHRGTDTMGMNGEMNDVFDTSTVLGEADRGRDVSSKESVPSAARLELLARLQSCIASLSNHIYYTDQITDMLTAILARLKPSNTSDLSNTTAAINDPAGATRAIANSAKLEEDPNTDEFFSFANARVVALKVIKRILIRANNRRSSTGSSIESRSRVGIQVWQGTQWLLKDEDRTVRAAYVDALLTWLKLETNSSDLLLPRDGSRRNKNGKKTGKSDTEDVVTKRAASSSSRRETRPVRSTFVQLLHLAVYDSLLEEPESQTNVLMLYLLLTHLVERLGVNAVRSGFPMIMRLQQVVLQESKMGSLAKVYLSSLTQGYLWMIAEKFDFEGTKVGFEINGEISRRKRALVWFELVHFPALSLDHVARGAAPSEKSPVYAATAIDFLKPFLSVSDLVDEVAKAYNVALLTPSTSPPSSPGRVFSVPTLGFGYGYGSAAGPRPLPHDQFPQKVKDEIGGSWSREQCIAAVEKESAGSTTGSRTGRSSGHRHLQANGVPRAGSTSGRETPVGKVPSDDGQPAAAILTGLAALQMQRRGSGHGSIQPPTGTSSRESTVRVLDLKRALSGYGNDARHSSPLRRPITNSKQSVHSNDSDSMMSWNEAEEKDTTAGDGPNRLDDKNLERHDEAIGEPFGILNSTNGNATTQQAQLTSSIYAAVTSPGPDSQGPPSMSPPALDLPGTYPREASSARPVTSHGESRHTAPFSSTHQRPSSSKAAGSINSSQVGSVREGRRPGSRRGGNDKHQPQEKFDLKELLAAIPSGNSILSSAQHSEKGLGSAIGNESLLSETTAISKPPY